MQLSISTNWNSRQHEDGEAMVGEILAAGLDAIELGYALTHRQADDVRRLQAAGTIRVLSVHAYCPVPMGVSSGSPEIFSICDAAPRARARAVRAVLESVQLAAEIGAGVVVLHAGRVPLGRKMRQLVEMAAAGRRHEPRYEKRLARLLDLRARRAGKVYQRLLESLDELLPQCEKLGVTLALENLPTVDAMPNEGEIQQLCQEFAGAPLAGWHDFGHAQVRENLGLIHHPGIVRRLVPLLAGFHLQDIVGVEDAHLMPPGGEVKFERFRDLSRLDLPAVLEPAPGTPVEYIRRAVDFLNDLWA